MSANVGTSHIANLEWHPYDANTQSTLPLEGAQVLIMLLNGKVYPATFSLKGIDGHFAIQFLPWGEQSPITKWAYSHWNNNFPQVTDI